MAKFTGPKGKLVRRFGSNIFDSPKYDRLLERKNHPPGQHGDKQQRRKLSDYGLQLLEKQKLKSCYGLLEKQFRRTFDRASQQKGITGDNLLRLLETRLDNTVFRAGFGTTRMQARQLINHGHLQVNGRRVTIPSFQVKSGDVVSVRNTEKSRQLVAKNILSSPRFQQPNWVEVSSEKQQFAVQRLPARDEINVDINEQLIIELYSK
ncbi:MAG: 30S ribosomal protein S4 [Desulfuromonadales bacterium]|nr:30S ribosomal protein S4 [Desulfuromonadales bacterium]MBN2792656.1 30S ribosomal protein S4 [Desulfuromonadales bacterium]